MSGNRNLKTKSMTYLDGLAIVRIRGQSKKLQVQGAQFLRNEACLEYAAMIHPVKSALPPRFARFNRAVDAARHRNWTFDEAIKY